MATIIKIDFLFNTLIKVVSEWYDEYYMGTPEETNARKEIHLQILKDLYDPTRFETTSNLNKEKEEFLIEVQTAVEVIVSAMYHE
jgi:hypothetical protein